MNSTKTAKPGPIDQVLDESFESGNIAPNERTDLAVPQTDFSDLTVRNALMAPTYSSITIGVKHPAAWLPSGLFKQAKEKKWCEHCQVNHWSTTKCPYVHEQHAKDPNSTQEKPDAPTDAEEPDEVTPGEAPEPAEAPDAISASHMEDALTKAGLAPAKAKGLALGILKKFTEQNPTGEGVTLKVNQLANSLLKEFNYSLLLGKKAIGLLTQAGVIKEENGLLSLSGPVETPATEGGAAPPPPGSQPKVTPNPNAAQLGAKLGFNPTSIGWNVLGAVGSSTEPITALDAFTATGMKGHKDASMQKKLENILNYFVAQGDLQKVDVPGGHPQYFFGEWAPPDGAAPAAEEPLPEPIPGQEPWVPPPDEEPAVPSQTPAGQDIPTTGPDEPAPVDSAKISLISNAIKSVMTDEMAAEVSSHLVYLFALSSHVSTDDIKNVLQQEGLTDAAMQNTIIGMMMVNGAAVYDDASQTFSLASAPPVTDTDPAQQEPIIDATPAGHTQNLVAQALSVFSPEALAAITSALQAKEASGTISSADLIDSFSSSGLDGMGVVNAIGTLVNYGVISYDSSADGYSILTTVSPIQPGAEDIPPAPSGPPATPETLKDVVALAMIGVPNIGQATMNKVYTALAQTYPGASLQATLSAAKFDIVFGQLLKLGIMKANGSLNGDGQTVTATGVCSNYHKTYKSPCPSNCPSCGTPYTKKTPLAAPQTGTDESQADPGAGGGDSAAFTPSDPGDAFEQLEINPGGKSITFLKALNSKPQGLTLDEALTACPNPPSGSPKITGEQATQLLTKAVEKGLVTKTPEGKYLFGKPGASAPKPPRENPAKAISQQVGQKIGLTPAEQEYYGPGLDKLVAAGQDGLDPQALSSVDWVTESVNQMFEKLHKKGLLNLVLQPSGAYKAVLTPNAAPPDPNAFTPSSVPNAMANLGWNHGGKGEHILKELQKTGPQGKNPDEIVAEWPFGGPGQPNKPSKPTPDLMASLMDKLVTGGLATKLPNGNVVFGTIGTQNALPQLTILPPPPPPPIPAALIVIKTGLSKPAVIAPKKPPPHGCSMATYEAAHIMGVDLHDAAAKTAWDASPEGNAHKQLDAHSRTGTWLAAKGATKESLQKMVTSGAVLCSNPQLLFSGNNTDWKSKNVHFTQVVIRRNGDKAIGMPPASQVVWETGADGKAKMNIHLSPEFEDAIGGWLADLPGSSQTKASYQKLMSIISTKPGKRWSMPELMEVLDFPNKASVRDLIKSLRQGVLSITGDSSVAIVDQQNSSLSEGSVTESVIFNLPVLMSATKAADGVPCPKCKVKHRPTTKCPMKGETPVATDATWNEAEFTKKNICPVFSAIIGAPGAVPQMTPSGPPPAPVTLQAACAEMGLTVGSVGATLLSALSTPQTPATLNAAMAGVGFQAQVTTLLQLSITKGVVEVINGTYSLKGTVAHKAYAALGPAASQPQPGQTSALVPDMASQAQATAQGIRLNYASDHPIQHMDETHAKMYHAVQQHFDKVLASHPTIRKLPPGRRLMEHLLTVGASMMHPLAITTNSFCAEAWKGASTSIGGRLYATTISQLGMNTSLTASHIKGMEPNGIDSASKAAAQEWGLNSADYGGQNHDGIHINWNVKDPDAPILFRLDSGSGQTPEAVAQRCNVDVSSVKKVGYNWVVKGPSRTDILLQQMAMNQAASRLSGEDSQTLYRGVSGGLTTTVDSSTGAQSQIDMVKEMTKDQDTGVASIGRGAKVFLSGASSWSCSHGVGNRFSNSNGVLFGKEVPNYLQLMNYRQSITDPITGSTTEVFRGLTNSESETIVLGHPSTTIVPITKTFSTTDGKITKISQKAPVSGGWPSPNPKLPPGFGVYQTLASGETFWITREEVMACTWPGGSFEYANPLEDLSVKRAYLDWLAN